MVPVADSSDQLIEEALKVVNLRPHDVLGRYPHQLSGGERQRVMLARAYLMKPRVIVADECVAALDVTIQAQIVDLFRDLARRTGLTLVFIAHDLAIVRNLCERVVVMPHGEIVEGAPSAGVFARPEKPYTAALIAAIPDIDPDRPLNGGQLTNQQELAE